MKATPQPMAVPQAFALVAQACGSFQGNLQDHLTIQTALKTIREALGIPEGELVGETDVPVVDGTNGATPNRQQRRAQARTAAKD